MTALGADKKTEQVAILGIAIDAITHSRANIAERDELLATLASFIRPLAVDVPAHVEAAMQRADELAAAGAGVSPSGQTAPPAVSAPAAVAAAPQNVQQ